ncbi:TPA: ead/Ea22-like family protein [Serratia marcescens]
MDKFSELKAAAMAATPGPWESIYDDWSDGDDALISCESRDGMVAIAKIEGGGSESSFDGSFRTEQQANTRYIAATNPAVVLALLAELEAKDKRIAELEAIRAAAEKLVRCKGRYHSEQNYRALAALFGVTTPDLPPVEGDSEAVITELRAKLATPVRLPTAMFCPEEYVGSLLWSETEAHNKAISKCAEALRAAGFKVEGDAQ